MAAVPAIPAMKPVAMVEGMEVLSRIRGCYPKRRSRTDVAPSAHVSG